MVLVVGMDACDETVALQTKNVGLDGSAAIKLPKVGDDDGNDEGDGEGIMDG